MKAYYNEFDAKAAAWLRELIKAGLIADGDVDERSILEVKADDLKGYTQCHFFAGIGGWSLAIRSAGWRDEWPVWTGSCPCQPLSCAGQRKGHADERHLWPAFYDLISECRPATVFGEQVASKDGREWFAGVRADLEGVGYACGAADLCAAGVGAPHKRQRLFWVAEADGGQSGYRGLQRGREHGQQQADGALAVGQADSKCSRLEGHAGDERDRNEPGRIGARSAGSTAEGGEPGAVADAECHEEHKEQRGPAAHEGRRCADQPCGCSVAGGMGNASIGGRRVGGDAARAGRGGYPERTGWSGFEIVHCRDGKARRFESSSFPLAHGVPGRVGLLRGYGNAIVPQVAEVFVRAFMECANQQGDHP